MRRLPETIPAWAGDCIGIPFRAGGRDRSGLDCWGLVRLVYLDRFGVVLPALVGRYDDVRDREAIDGLITEQVAGETPTWRPVAMDEASVGDVAMFRLEGRHSHVGVLVARHRVLHAIEPSGVCIERIDTPLWSRRCVGAFRHAAPVNLVCRPGPIATRRGHALIPEGLDIGSTLAAAGIESTGGLRVFLNGREVRKEAWPHVRPKAGRTLTVLAVPQGGDGGGKTALRIVGTIAIIAAAAYFPPVLGFASGSVGAAVAAGVIGIGGAFLLNALAPPPKPRLSAGADGQSPTIAGAQNEMRPYAPIPVILGTHRVVPPFGAAPYTEVSGDEQFLRLLFVVGYGPLEISDIRIGETPIEEFDGVELEIRSGMLTDDPVRLYPDTVHEESLSVLLDNATEWVSRTSQSGADELSVDLTFPTGLAYVNNDGSRSSRTVQLDVQYRPVGGAWLNPNGNAGAVGSPISTREMDLLFRTPEATYGDSVPHTQFAVNWGTGFGAAKPSYLPASGYSWMFEAWVQDDAAPEGGGNYVFAVDSSDACDLEIDGRVVCSWYGSHTTQSGGAGGPDFSPAAHQSAPVHMGGGLHRFRVRMEARSGAGAVAVGWKRPGQSTFAVIPGSAFRVSAGTNDTRGGRATWYTTSTYVGTLTVTEARTDQLRRTLAWAPAGGRGQYEVRVRRISPDSTDQHALDQVYWSGLRSITNEDPIQLPGLAKIALRIKATDQLNGVVDQLSCLASSIVTDYTWEFGTWGFQRATSNPAALYRHILQGRANARPLTDDRLDLDELAAWHDACRAGGLEFNGVLDTQGTVYERLTDVAAAGRASFGMRDGRYSIVRDRVQDCPVQHLTPANSFGFRGRRAFPDSVHALRIRFLDRTNDYQQAERLVYDDGYDASNATKFETIELFGVTDPEQAWKHGRYHLAVARLRPEVFELATDVEHLVCSRGDLVLVNHDVPLIGEGFGRVTRLTTDAANNLLGIVIDHEVTLAPGLAYCVRVRLEDGTSFLRDVATPAGGAVTTALTFIQLVAAGQTRPKIGDLVQFGRPTMESREMIVQRLEVNQDLSARLTLVDHAPAVHAADQGVIPAFDAGISLPPDFQAGPEAPVIDSIRSDDWVMVRSADGSLIPRMVITLRRQSGTRPLATLVQVRTRARPPAPAEPTGPWTDHPLRSLDNNQVAIEPVQVGATYQIQVRVQTPIGQVSRWTSAEHTVVGNILPPPDVQAFDVVEVQDGVRMFEWTLGTIPPDVAGVLIRYGPLASNPTWEQMSPLHTGVLDAASPQEMLEPAAGSWRLGIKMVDTRGNSSVNAVMVDRSLGAMRPLSLVLQTDVGAGGWTGTKTDCHVSGTALLADTGRTSFTYEHDVIDLGAVLVAVPSALVTTNSTLGTISNAQTIEFSYSTDGATWSDWLTYDVTIGTSGLAPGVVNGRAFSARYHRWRLVASANGLVTSPSVSSLVVSADAQPREHLIDNLNTASLTGAFRLGTGDVRLPIDANRFGLIRHVNLTFNGSGAGYSYIVADKTISPGPRVKIYDASNNPADATIDAMVRGF